MTIFFDCTYTRTQQGSVGITRVVRNLSKQLASRLASGEQLVLVVVVAGGDSFRLVFAGNEGWLADRFRSELRRCQAAGLDVGLLTSVSDEELAGLYSRCHCTVFCSFAEGFGLPILESLHFHRPVVVSDRGSMAEIAAHGGCVLVDPEDVESVAGGLRRLLVDSAFHEELTRQARAIRWCTWAEYADRIYGFALGEKSTREIESARERGP